MPAVNPRRKFDAVSISLPGLFINPRPNKRFGFELDT